MSDFTVPDMIEPITAYRSWVTDFGTTELRSHNAAQWPKREKMEAYCQAGHDKPTTRQVAGWELQHDRLENRWLRDLEDSEWESYRFHHAPKFVTPSYSSMSAVSFTYMTGATGVAPAYPVEQKPDPEPLVAPDVWLPPGYTLALSHRDEMYPPMHGQAPDMNCSCGVYCLDSLNAIKRLYGTDVMGEIYIWGKVIEGERGYRAQFAYPKVLEWHGKGQPPEYLHEYGVPVVNTNVVSVAIPTTLAKVDNEITKAMHYVVRGAEIFLMLAVLALYFLFAALPLIVAIFVDLIFGWDGPAEALCWFPRIITDSMFD